MQLIPFFFHLFSLALTTAQETQYVVQETPQELGIPEINARYIFNAIHSAMRQWGSSIQHNGMSFFPASIPQGTTLYHGTGTPERVTGMEWLAFEIEHAEHFAHIRGRGHRRPPISIDAADKDDPDPWPLPEPGYLHFYRTNRHLDKLLYIDGMGAGKSDIGTLDTQDLVLLNASLDPLNDYQRASLLCELGSTWGIEGFVRMEAGFELVLCNFSDGLDFISQHKRPPYNDAEGYDDRQLLEYFRSVSSRYLGIGASRVLLDYSSMVSAYFFGANLSNPDFSSDLPRLVSATPEQLSRIRAELECVLRRPRTHGRVDWQGVVDLIVTRYQDRLQFLASNPPRDSFLATVNHLLNLFIDYGPGNRSEEAPPKEQCSLHYLQAIATSTPQDDFILEAILAVTRRICTTLFEVRNLLLLLPLDHCNLHDQEEVGCVSCLQTKEKPAQLIRDLITWLDWSVWKSCPTCPYDEVCFVAAWPFGDPEDHYSPRCRDNTEMRKRMRPGTYWHVGE